MVIGCSCLKLRRCRLSLHVAPCRYLLIPLVDFANHDDDVGFAVCPGDGVFTGLNEVRVLFLDAVPRDEHGAIKASVYHEADECIQDDNWKKLC